MWWFQSSSTWPHQYELICRSLEAFSANIGGLIISLTVNTLYRKTTRTRTVPRGTPGSFSWKDQLDNDSIERNNERSQFKANQSVNLAVRPHIRPWLSSASRGVPETLTAVSSTSSNFHSQTKPENSDIDCKPSHFWSYMLPSVDLYNARVLSYR